MSRDVDVKSGLHDGLPFSENGRADSAVAGWGNTSENTLREPESGEPVQGQSLARPAPATAGAVATSGDRCRCGAEQDPSDPSRCARKHTWRGYPGPALRTGRFSVLLAAAPELPVDWRRQCVTWGYQHIVNVNQALAARPGLARSMRWLRQWRELVKDVNETLRELEREDAAASRTSPDDSMTIAELEQAVVEGMKELGLAPQPLTASEIIERVLTDPRLRDQVVDAICADTAIAAALRARLLGGARAATSVRHNVDAGAGDDVGDV